MRKLAAFLKKKYFRVHSIDYPSTRMGLEQLREYIWEAYFEGVQWDGTVHLVGYSMGGLIIRALLHHYQIPNLGRVVQLAPPNHGSEVADVLKNFWPYKKLYGPAGQQLTTDQAAIRHLFGEVYYELGVIAGDLSLDPISSRFIRGNDDGKVSIESTKLEGMKDHIVVKASHTLFPHSREVQEQTLSFLRDGCFRR